MTNASIHQPKPGLFGLEHSNRDFSKADDWGKNKFNSAFPASLACYMGSKGIDPVYLTLNGSLTVDKSKIPVAKLFGLAPLSANLHFQFESQYTPYSPYVVGVLPRVDLVTMDYSSTEAITLGGLEIKLTALPDNQTFNLPENKQSSEIVVRPDTIVYLGISICTAYATAKHTLFNLLDPVCSTITDWADPAQVFPEIARIGQVLNNVLLANLSKQKPFLLQPVWKTKGKSSVLADDCFDIFVWSDFGFTRLFMDAALKPRPGTNIDVKRQARAVFWLAKMLYDFSKHGQFNHKEIFDKQGYNTRNDKAFSVTGKLTHPYLKCNELTQPRVPKEALREIILGGGQNFLSPERRLDAAIVTTPGLFSLKPIGEA